MKSNFLNKINNKKIFVYLSIFFVIILGISFYANFLPKNSFGANEKKLVLQANIEKYLNYKISDTDKGTLLQFNINTFLENNENPEQVLPIKQSQLKIEMNQIDGKYPYEVKVININTELTNGNSNEIEVKKRYNQENGTLIIQASNFNDKQELINTQIVSDNAKDEYSIICYYDTYTEKPTEREIAINAQAILVCEEDNNLINAQESFKGKVTDNISELTSVEYNTQELANGYIKANIINNTNYDTEYKETQNIIVSKQEAQEKIWFKESNTFVNGANEEENNNELIYKSTKISKENLTKILGENGKLEILDIEQNVISIIDENTNWDEDGTYTVNYENDMTSLLIKTSEIKDVGILKLENTKLIKNSMKNLDITKIKTICNIFGINEEISNNENKIENGEVLNNTVGKITYNNKKENEVEIKDATTNVEVNLNKSNWTNKEQNEIIFDINLRAMSFNENMFKNPNIKIELPEEVEKVVLGDSHIFYGEDFTLDNVYLEENEGKFNIIANITGNQIDYYKNDLDLVTNIKIPATVILKKDIANETTNIELEYRNEFNINNETQVGKLSKELKLENYKNENIEVSNNNVGVTSVRKMLRNTSKSNDSSSNRIKTEVELLKGNSKLDDRAVVYEGEYIKYNIKVTNISEEEINNIKVIGSIPDGTVYGELEADYHNYMGNYKYNFDENLKNKEIEVGTLKSGEIFNSFYEVKVSDLEDGITEQEIATSINTFINENLVNNYNITNTIKRAEVKAFLGAFIDNSEDRWNYTLKIESEENKEFNVKLVFPEEFKVELRVQAGGQDGKYQPVIFDENQGSTITDTIEANKEYWYEGSINSNLIRESLDNKVVLKAYATVEANDVEYKSNENRIEYETRSASVTMTSENEGDEIHYNDEINYEIEIKNTGRTNLNQEEIDVFSVDVQDYLPEELKPISINYENWEQTEGVWTKKELNKDIEHITLFDEKGNKLPDVDLTLTIPYQKNVKIIVKTKAKEVFEKTKIENSVTITGRYINTKTSNIISHTILPFIEIDGNSENKDKEDIEDNNLPDQDKNQKEDEEASKKESNKHSISGIAWIDENTDGQRQGNEEKLGNIEVLLVDTNNTSKVCAKTTTNSEGKYQFNNLTEGKYIVLFKYEKERYFLTEYQKSGVSEEYNSDANNKNIKLDGKEISVGATDIIVLNSDAKNRDIGLIKNGICDLKLDKFISKVTVATNKGTKQYSYNDQKLAKVEVHSKEIEGANIEVEYKIVVTNEGEIPTFVNKVTDYIPEGFTFETSSNKNWGIQTGGKLINNSLVNKKLTPGESAELTLVLTKKMTANAIGEYKNMAEITEISNEQNIADCDSTPGNRLSGEDDYSEATLIISISTGGIVFIGIAILSILILILVSTILARKGIIKNNNITKIAKLSVFIVILSGIMFAKDNAVLSATSTNIERTAPQTLWFNWQPDSSHVNFFGSICFISPTNEWEAHCQNAGLRASDGEYRYQKATGLIDEEGTSSTQIPNITIKKQDWNEDDKNYDVVGIEKVMYNYEEYWLYGPISFECNVKNKPADKKIKYYIEATTYNETIKIEALDNGDSAESRIRKGANLQPYTFGEHNGKERFYLMLKKDELVNSNDHTLDGLFRITVTAKVDGTTISKKPTKGFLHYYYDNYSQSVKTVQRQYCENKITENTFECKDTEEWDTFNIQININKLDYDDSTTKLPNVGFRIIKNEKGTKKKYALKNLELIGSSYGDNDPKGYKEDDWILFNVKNLTPEEYNSIIHMTSDNNISGDIYEEEQLYGRILLKNLKAIGIEKYEIYEMINNYYGYKNNIAKKKGDIDLYQSSINSGDFSSVSNCGRIIDLDVTNIKNTGNLEIKKTDQSSGKNLEGIKFKIRKKAKTNDKEQYVVAVDEDNNIKTSVTGSILLGNLNYTENKEEATEFKTNANGLIRVYNLLCDDYIIEEIESPDHLEYDINDEDSISWTTSCKDTDNQTTTSEGKGKEIEVSIKRQKSTETKSIQKKISNHITVSNKKQYVRIKGYAFEDGISGKASERNNLYDNNTADKRLKGVLVKLYKKDENNNSILVDSRTTDENGEYSFGDYNNDIKYDENGNEIPIYKIKIDELESYYVEFEYNGMNYEATDIVMQKDEQGNETDLVVDNSSKVIENISKDVKEDINKTREDFNNNYSTIEYNKSKNADNETNLEYNYDKDKYVSKLKLGNEDEIIYGYEGQEYPISGIYDQYKMTANTDDNIYSQNEHVKKQRILGQNLTIDEIKTMKNSEITNVNLGLRKREMADLAISTDINNVELNINGYKHIYEGKKRFGTAEERKSYSENNDDENAIFNATVKAESKYKADSYTRELYESDCKFTGINPFEAYITYEVKIRNEATSLISTVNSLVNYYDQTYLDPISYKINNNDDISIIEESKKNFNDVYRKLELNGINIQIDAQKEKSVFIKFKLIKYEGITYDTELNKKVAMLNNYTEIASYSTIDNKGNIYGIVDKDSNPANFNLNEIDERNQYNEDDNDKAPTFKVVFDKARQLQGTVFLDDLIELKNGGVGKERQGNGRFDSNENTIKGVKVGLYKITDFDENGILKDNAEPVGKTYYTSKVNEDDISIDIDGETYYYNQNGITAEDGEFIVTDFIPGDYKLVYTWGENTFTIDESGNTINIDTQDYKGTIWTEQNRQEKFINGNINQENKEWYRNQVEDANGQIVRFTDAKDNWNIRENNKKIMQSTTNELRLGIELNDDINSKAIISKIIENNIKFVVPNIDFGIVERAKQSLAIAKKVENINVTLANGQTIINAQLDENGNLLGTPKGINYLPAENGKSQILISLDSELIQGTKADITYKIAVKNNSEKDYTTQDYYYYGITDEKYLVKIQPDGVYDYLDNTMVLNTESNQIENNGEWVIKTLNEYNTYTEGEIDPTIIEQYLYDNNESTKVIKGYESFNETYSSAITEWTKEKIIDARQKRLASKTILHNSKLEEPIELGGENYAILKVSKILSNQDEIDLNNDCEIVKIKNENDSGRLVSIHPIIEELYDKAESVAISANPGKTDYTIEILQIILSGLVIIATGIVFVKKKIIK